MPPARGRKSRPEEPRLRIAAEALIQLIAVGASADPLAVPLYMPRQRYNCCNSNLAVAQLPSPLMPPVAR